MPRLPDANDLSRAPQVEQQNVVSIDGSQMGRALENAGARVSNLADNMQRRQDYVQEREDRMNAAKAAAKFRQGMIGLESQFDQDQDYKTYGQRYQAGVNKLKSESASIITNRSMREMFELDADNEIAVGYDRISQKSLAKEKDNGNAVLGETLGIERENALRSPSEQQAVDAINRSGAAIDAAKENGYISAAQAQRLKQETAIDHSIARMGMLPPDARIKALQAKGMAEMIPADKRAAMIEAAQAESLAAQYQSIKLRNLQRQEAGINALNQIEEGVPPTSIKGWASMDAGQRNGLLRYYKGIQGGEFIPTDYNRYYELAGMAADPKKRDEFSQMDLTTESNLGIKEFKELAKMQRDILDDDTKAQAQFVTVVSNKQAADRALESITGKKPGKLDDEDLEFANAFYRVMNTEMNDWVADNPESKGKVPPEVRDSIIDKLSMKMVSKREFFGVDVLAPDAEKSVLEEIVSDMEESNVPVNAATIYRTYMNAKARGVID